jgi:uncharacterized protein (DUF58 family)
MALTPLGLLLLSVSIPLMALSVWGPALVRASLVWAGAVLALAIVDSLFTRRLAKIELVRSHGENLALGVDNPITVTVRSRAPLPLRLVVKDDPPTQFDTPRRETLTRVAAYDEAQATYLTRPRARGDYHFGNLHARGRGLLGLSYWQRDFRAAADVKVFPNLLEVEKYDYLVRASRLHEAGYRVVRRHGEGTEFESLREYVPDDDFRRVDWKATARRRVPISRELEIERSQNLILMLDAGRMMSAEWAGLSKLDYAINAALMLAYVAVQKDDAVGLVVFADAVQTFVPPTKGRAQVGRLLHELYGVQARLEEPDYGAAFSLLYGRARKRALVVIFTDLIDARASEELLAHTAALYPHHLPLLITLRDSDLVAAAASAPEDEQAAYRKAIATRLLQEREQVASALRQRGAMVLDVEPEHLTVKTVNEYLAVKARGRL